MNQDKIGKFLASLRKENNLTQEDIAEKLNVNVKSVSRWENGRNLPDPSIMKEICKIYNVSINELFNGEKVKKSNKVRQIFLFYIIVSLTALKCILVEGEPIADEHSKLIYLKKENLKSLVWAPADIPLVDKVINSNK